MKINNLDLLHHKILVGKSQGGDVAEYENKLHQQLKEGVKNKCPFTLDFINRLNANKPLILNKRNTLEKIVHFFTWKPRFLNKHRKTILKISEPVHTIICWFLIASIATAFIVELYYA
jgi:hypothetical protein